MADSFQNEVPKARINLRLNLHTGGAQKKVELPLKLLTVGDFSNGRENRPLSEREKKDINKNNFGSVLAEFSPQVNLAVENTLAGDGSEENILLTLPNCRLAGISRTVTSLYSRSSRSGRSKVPRCDNSGNSS
ncbi:hypothetical protein D3C78_460080 [compost metagenome]